MTSSARNPTREAERGHFLRTHGWHSDSASLLAADASFRCYFRLQEDKRRAVLMDAPSPMEDVRPFLAIDGHLNRLGLSAPKVYAADTSRGFLLLEDFGDDTYTRLLRRGENATELYSLAVDTLVHLHTSAEATAIDLPAYDISRLLQEASLFTDWFMPAHRGAAVTIETRQQYLDVWERLLLPITTQAPMLVLRDYHVDNLMRLPDRTGVTACGLLDFQDAVIGSPAYDLVSLLEDARRDVDGPLQELMLARYLRLAPDRADTVLRDYRLLGVQRHCKVAGIFVRLFVRDGKASYLKNLVRVMRHLESGLQTERLAPLRAWFDRHFPTRLEPLPRLDREQLLPISGAPKANAITIGT